MIKLNEYIDHTLLKPTAQPNDIIKLCEEAIHYGFYAVCVNSYFVPLACIKLSNTNIKIAAVVGFPLGANTTKVKIFEAKECITNGADEVDMVINIGVFKAGNYDFVENEIRAIKKAIGHNVLKVIIETCYLTKEEIEAACRLVLNSGADYIKTSTGFGSGGATPEGIKLIKKIVKNKIKIKASGGIKDTETTKKYIKLGVSRIGTSSGIAIVNSEKT